MGQFWLLKESDRFARPLSTSFWLANRLSEPIEWPDGGGLAAH